MAKGKVTITGDKELAAALKRLQAAARGEALADAAQVGIMPIQNRIIVNAPRKTGTYARSWHTELVASTDLYAEAVTGSDVEYGPRLEFGFEDTDARGRQYHQPARPHVRPAYEAERQTAIEEVANALRVRILGAV